MARVVAALLLGAALAAGIGLWRSPSACRPPPQDVGLAPARDGPAPRARVAAAAPPAVAADPSAEDPEALAAWFEQEVLRAIEGAEPARPAPPAPRARASERADRAAAPPHEDGSPRLPRHGAPTASALRRLPIPPDHLAIAERLEAERPGRIDWAYVRDVFDGRVSGVPSERRAGLTLQEMDQLGDVPYVEQLRADGAYDALRDLGFEHETVAWPGCLRTGTCRMDDASTPDDE